MGPDSRKGRSTVALFLLGLVLPLMTGTTYVVLEGEREVGRYEEHDGSSEVRYVKNEAPRPSAASNPESGTKQQTFFRDPLEGFGKKYLDYKIEDPDLIRYLSRQPWMAKLREWDSRYDLEKNLTRYRPFFVWAVLCLLGLAVFLRALRILRWIFFRKK